MKKSQVTLSGGASFTNIPVTCPSHSIKILELNATPVGLIVEWPDDAFANSYTYPKGAAIRKSGNGIYGVLGYHANAIAGKTRSADLYCKVKAADNSNAVIELTEYQFGEDAAS